MTALHGDTLEWAAQWILDSLKGETNERVMEFGKNMAMTLRAATTEQDVSVREEGGDVGERVCVTAEQLLDCLLTEYRYWRDNECSGSIGATGSLSNVIAFATVPSYRADWHPEKYEDCGEGPTGCADDQDHEMRRAVRGLTQQDLTRILDETLRPAPDTRTGEGDAPIWKCSCGDHNTRGRKVCGGCGLSKPVETS